MEDEDLPKIPEDKSLMSDILSLFVYNLIEKNVTWRGRYFELVTRDGYISDLRIRNKVKFRNNINLGDEKQNKEYTDRDEFVVSWNLHKNHCMSMNSIGWKGRNRQN